MGPGQYHSPIIITILAVLYAWTFSSVFVADELSPIPKNQQGLNITSAVNDLHRIAARPRPYNSHANDAARAYILTRVRDITGPHSSFVQVSNDLTSNASFLDDGGTGTYFEGANILVKIDGTDERYRKTGGVLFSAHFDSVSTAKGVSDDGMSVVACLQMIEFLVQNRPKRTAVFNINNGEEDGLYGAQIFIQHPWFAIVDTFLNMEGAAAGGRPIIFRTTSSNPLSSFHSLPHPHANVISSDGFSRGLIRGATDFAVYAKGLDTNKTNERQGGKQGVDVAFYKHRSFYHTKYDDIAYTEGGERALWSMVEVARGGGWAMLNKADDDDSGNDDAGVYFDLFGKSLILFTQRALLIINIVLLIVGPVSIIALVFIKAIISRRVARAQRHVPSQNTLHESVWQSTKRWVKLTVLDVTGARMKTRFWSAFVLNGLAQVVFVWMYLKINPNIMYSQPFTVFATTMLLAFIALSFPLLFHLSHHSTPYADRKQSILLQLYILTYILSLGSTPLLAGVSGPGIGGVYFLTALHAGVWLGSLVGCIEGIINARHGVVDETVIEEVEEEREEHHPPPRTSDERPREASNGSVSRSGKLLVRGVRFEVSEEEGEATSVAPDGTRQGVIVETEPTEITPLIPSGDSADEPRRALDELSAAAGQRSDARYLERKKGLLGRVIPWTAIQLALVVPVPVVLMLHVVVLLLNGIPETLADGGKSVIVYGSASIFSTLLVLPILPFVLPRFPKNPLVKPENPLR